MRLAVITTVSGRHAHLLRQREGLRLSAVQPDLHVVVAMGDPEIDDLLDAEPAVQVVHLPQDGRPLPLAQARNTGASIAIGHGADVLVFLDVDCIASLTLVGTYARWLSEDLARDTVLSGTVHYLPPSAAGVDLGSLDAISQPHAARPAPGEGEVTGLDPRLFWSLSFALRTDLWERLGGFCEDYVGYGGEDTDFGQVVHAHGARLLAVGGATAYHQHHEVSDPPVQHLAEILANAAVFHHRWRWWPMRGWLDAFETAGLVRYDVQHDSWQLTTGEVMAR